MADPTAPVSVKSTHFHPRVIDLPFPPREEVNDRIGNVSVVASEKCAEGFAFHCYCTIEDPFCSHENRL